MDQTDQPLPGRLYNIKESIDQSIAGGSLPTKPFVRIVTGDRSLSPCILPWEGRLIHTDPPRGRWEEEKDRASVTDVLEALSRNLL